MNCVECREAMLEADPELLTGSGDGGVQQHLQSCVECRAVAAGLGSELRKVQSAFSAIQPSVGATDIVARAMDGESKVLDITLSTRRRGARGFALKMASIAAAAAIVIVLADRREKASLRSEADAVLPDSASTAIAVEVPEGRNAIVFDTKNPLISVVWIY